MDGLDLLAVHGTLKSLQHHSSKILVIVTIFIENQSVNSLLDSREDKINNKISLNLRDSHSNKQKYLSSDIHVEFSLFFTYEIQFHP